MARSQKEKAIMAEVLSRAVGDEEYRKKLVNSPNSTLEEAGLEIKPGMEVRVLQNTDKVRHVIIPHFDPGELSEQALGQIAGGDVEAQSTNTTTTAEAEFEVAAATVTVTVEVQDAATTTTVVAECEVVFI